MWSQFDCYSISGSHMVIAVSWIFTHRHSRISYRIAQTSQKYHRGRLRISIHHTSFILCCVQCLGLCWGKKERSGGYMWSKTHKHGHLNLTAVFSPSLFFYLSFLDNTSGHTWIPQGYLLWGKLMQSSSDYRQVIKSRNGLCPQAWYWWIKR